MMTKDQIRAEVKNIIAEIAPDEDLSTVTDDGPLRNQLNLDSMDFLDIVMELRKRHKIHVPEEEYKQLATLNSCADYLDKFFNKPGNA